MVNLKQYGYTEYAELPAGELPGRVTEIQRESCVVITELGETSAVLTGQFHHNVKTQDDYPCVGDFVFLQYSSDGVSRITKVLPRRSKFSRANFSGHAVGYAKTILEQLVAANFDYVFIMSSLNCDFNVSRIMRYLTLARQSGGQPVLILTKVDLVGNADEHIEKVRRAAPDVPVHAVSSHFGMGLSELDEYLRPSKTVVFLGMSGVGKSSLLNALMSAEVMTVKAIREDDSRGRHTTTHRQLFMLPSGAMVIDTPGMREIGLFNADEGLSAGFSDIEELMTQCRFSNCRHTSEPGCAVLAALSDGSLPRERWEQYVVQKNENDFVANKSGYLNDKRARFKAIAMQNKHSKRNED